MELFEATRTRNNIYSRRFVRFEYISASQTHTHNFFGILFAFTLHWFDVAAAAAAVNLFRFACAVYM